MYTELRDWIEWQERCALGLCSAETAGRLASYAHARFGYYARKYIRRTGLTDIRSVTPPHTQCWHLFETRATVGQTRTGKSYKRWIFARGEQSHDNLLDVVQAGATLIIRDAVRDHLRKEAPPKRCVSLQTPMGGEDEGLTLEDLLPGTVDPGDALALRELDRMAAEYARNLFPETTERERLVLLARAQGTSFSSKKLARALRCSRSAMYSALRALIQRIVARLTTNLPGEDPQTLSLLTLRVINELKQAAGEWEKLDKQRTRIFRALEDVDTG